MKNLPKYWFYLEPYTFIFHVENKFLIYNTLNSFYLLAPEVPLVSEILNLLNDTSNGYCLVLDEKQVSDSVFIKFVMQLRTSLSGDLVKAESDTSKPFIFKPILFLNTNIRKLKEEDLSFLGDRILENLDEVSLYFPSVCEKQCAECLLYCKQMLHCSHFEGGNLSLENYLSLLLDLNISGVSKVNILGEDLVKSEYLQDLRSTLAKCKFKKIYHIHFDNLTDVFKDWLQEENTELVVAIHSGFIRESLETQMKQYSAYPIIWKFIVSSDIDIQLIEQLDLPFSINMELVPFYNGNNLSFFKENVCFLIDDIIAKPIGRKTIFRRQVLNENFFGKLLILPSGEVYANLNCRLLGVYPHDSLKKLVFEELTHSTAWFCLRDNQPCNSCLNKYLCPSISNYELVINRDDLCLIEK